MGLERVTCHDRKQARHGSSWPLGDIEPKLAFIQSGHFTNLRSAFMPFVLTFYNFQNIIRTIIFVGMTKVNSWPPIRLI